jgi:hypothetical protein
MMKIAPWQIRALVLGSDYDAETAKNVAREAALRGAL